MEELRSIRNSRGRLASLLRKRQKRRKLRLAPIVGIKQPIFTESQKIILSPSFRQRRGPKEWSSVTTKIVPKSRQDVEINDKEYLTSNEPDTKAKGIQQTASTSPQATNSQNEQVQEHEQFQDGDKSIRNDYCQHFVDSSRRPQNFIRDTELSQRFDEYPKLKELTKMKNALVASRATPPTYLKADLRTLELKSLGMKFDVILIDPPLEEYCRSSPMVAGLNSDYWTYDDIANLKIEDVAATPSFIFIWSGDSSGLDRGRQLLLKWGYRRCEDIVWIKTNKQWEGSRLIEPRSVFQRTKEHCIMGIKGTVRRSTDGHFIHCNVDTDVIISEEPPYGSTAKPEELYHIIEHFCLGRRRLELFGEDHNIRQGWLTVGSGLSSSNFDPITYAKHFSEQSGYLLGSTSEIEALRPKSPPPRDNNSTPKVGGPQGTNMKPKLKKQNQNIIPVPPMPPMQPFSRWVSMDGNVYAQTPSYE